MHRFEILPHTADVEIEAYGSDREELFRAALMAMFAAAEPDFSSGEVVERPFRLVSPDTEVLLVDFLNEAVASSDAEHEAYDNVRFSRLTEQEAEGTFVGRRVARFAVQIKAATHFGLFIKAEQRGLSAHVVFDA